MNAVINFKKIYKTANLYARKNGLPQDADDFAQECCIYAWKKNTEDVFFSRRFSDYVRKNYGRKGGISADVKRSLYLKGQEFNEKIHGVAGFESQDRRPDMPFGKYFDFVSKFQRLIYVLSKKYGIKITTLADSAGVSQGRISQIVEGVQAAVDQKIAREKSGIPRPRETDLESLLREERERMEREENWRMEAFSSF